VRIDILRCNIAAARRGAADGSRPARPIATQAGICRPAYSATNYHRVPASAQPATQNGMADSNEVELLIHEHESKYAHPFQSNRCLHR